MAQETTGVCETTGACETTNACETSGACETTGACMLSQQCVACCLMELRKLQVGRHQLERVHN